jgi:hypothetical protein
MGDRPMRHLRGALTMLLVILGWLDGRGAKGVTVPDADCLVHVVSPQF